MYACLDKYLNSIREDDGLPPQPAVSEAIGNRDADSIYAKDNPIKTLRDRIKMRER